MKEKNRSCFYYVARTVWRFGRKIRHQMMYYFILIRFCIKHQTFSLNVSEKRKEKVIVSITSYPKRFPQLYYCLKSVMDQTYKPDKIILYLSSDVSADMVPKNVLALQQYGLEIDFECADIKPHKKYYYSMQQYPDDVVITIDDDVIYEQTLIQKLVDSYKKYPFAVSCIRAHKMKFDAENRLLPYSQWEFECCDCEQPSMLFLATGVSGVLYPPHCLSNQAFDMERIKELCFGADDIWLKCMEILNHTCTVIVNCKKRLPFQIPKTQEVALANQNLSQNNNDIYIQKVFQAYDISLNELNHDGI